MARIALLLLLSLVAAPVCLAQSAVHHCVAADGTPVFTDQPCDSVQSLRMGAIPTRMHRTCPATREALRERVADAFARQDANALAGLMLWQGYSDTDAVREVARLKRLMQRPLLDVVDTAAMPPTPTSSPLAAQDPTPPPQAAMAGSLLVRLGGLHAGTGEPLRFAVAVRAGCLWLHP